MAIVRTTANRLPRHLLAILDFIGILLLNSSEINRRPSSLGPNATVVYVFAAEAQCPELQEPVVLCPQTAAERT